MIIGLAGKKQSGKTTVAQILRDMSGFKMESFADPIRKCIATLCGYTPEQLEEHKEDVHGLYGVTPRHMMQTLGTEWGREMISQSIWTDRLEFDLKQSPDTDVVIHDVRFENEAIMIREMGGHIVHVARHPEPDKFDSHVSEAGVTVMGIDFYMPNYGSIDDLHTEVKDLVSYIRNEE